MMARLNLFGMDINAAVCSEANPAGTGSAVQAISFVNLDRMLWAETHEDRRLISLQLDPDKWLILRFRKKTQFKAALKQMEAA